jgi:hypothetical protein
MLRTSGKHGLLKSTFLVRSLIRLTSHHFPNQPETYLKSVTMIRALFIFALVIAVASAFVTPASHGCKSMEDPGVARPAFQR